jgi:hypothetical protein
MLPDRESARARSAVVLDARRPWQDEFISHQTSESSEVDLREVSHLREDHDGYEIMALKRSMRVPGGERVGGLFELSKIA